MAQAPARTPTKPVTSKIDRPISFRVTPELRRELDTVCQVVGQSCSVIFRDALILYCRENPAIDDGVTERMAEAVDDMRARSNTGRIWPRQDNNGGAQ